jgi:TRAP-type C4-dicarboxylate transport system substrate-binding protein
MRKKNRSPHSILAPAAAMLIAAVFAIPFVEPAAAKELKLAHFMPEEHILHREVFTPLAAALAGATGGDLTVTIYSSGALGK